MNKKFLLALGCALLFGMLALFIGRQYLEEQVRVRQSREQVDVIVATVEIPSGTEINASQIALAKRNRSELPDSFVSRKEDVLGRVAQETILARSPIIERLLAAKDSVRGFPTTIRPGYRMISIPVNEASSVAGFVSPGSYVDIIAITQPSGSGKMISKVILQGIKVKATGDRYQITSANNNPAQNRSSVPNTVSLEVTPEQAEKLAISLKTGSLQLVLRNPTDQQEIFTRGENMNGVVGSLPAETPTGNTSNNSGARTSGNNPNMMAGVYPPMPIPTQSPSPSPEKKATPTPAPTPATFSVELIRGTSKEIRQFPVSGSQAGASTNPGTTQ
jgi:pilus assembly protein CpaB